MHIDDLKEIFSELMISLESGQSREMSPLMARIDGYIRNNYMHHLSVELVAEFAGKTPNYFSHIFKQEMGISFTSYVKRIRVEKAKELIINSDLMIYEISEQTGFKNYTYFCNVFKYIEGHTPSTLRKAPRI